jgi:carbon-monoxide dehydrogenase large subunit
MLDAALHRAWIGQSLPRFEDERLVRGAGSFIADLELDGMAHAVALRSRWAHARLRSVDVSRARAMRGVLCCLTASDVEAAGLGAIPWEVCPPPLAARARFPGDPAVAPPQPLLAGERVRYVGEPIAFIVATSRALALEAAEAVIVDAEELPAVVDAASALADGAPLIHENAPGNVLYEHEDGDAAATDTAFAQAAHVVTLASHPPRLTPAPIETRGYVGEYEAKSDRYTLHAAAGKPHPVRNTLASFVFKIEPSRIRVLARDIGGGFGGKNVVHAEQALVLHAAKLIRRPVVWIADRTESFMSDMQSRDHAIAAMLALDRRGRMLALRYRSDIALGAWLAPRGVIPTVSGLKVLTGAYAIPAAHAFIRAVHVNTPPTAPYRGAGVPETMFVLERLVDLAATKLRVDPVDLRRRNAIRPASLPWTSPTGTIHHSVDYPALIGAALAKAPPLPRSRASKSRMLRGRGVSLSLEAYGAAFDEQAEMQAHADGRVEVRIGTMSSGQGHATVYRQIAADALGLKPETISVLQGDTDAIERGNGTGASRSITTGGSALWLAARKLLHEARAAAGRALQAEPDLLSWRDGRFETASGGVPASIDFAGLAAIAGRSLIAKAVFRPQKVNIPAGCHLAEVEVDPETGVVTLLSYVAVQDSGVAINPRIVMGQMHGGVAQGIGEAMLERLVWDKDNGQLLTASFMDYAMPRADDLPAFDISLVANRCASNLLGAKAAGECGPVAAPPAIVNAVVDALRPLGVTHLEMPLTPERVWSAIKEARA